MILLLKGWMVLWSAVLSDKFSQRTTQGFTSGFVIWRSLADVNFKVQHAGFLLSRLLSILFIKVAPRKEQISLSTSSFSSQALFFKMNFHFSSWKILNLSGYFKGSSSKIQLPSREFKYSIRRPIEGALQRMEAKRIG